MGFIPHRAVFSPKPIPREQSVLVVTGDCDDLGDKVIWFNDILEKSGEHIGDAAAIQATAGINSSAEFSLNDAIAEGYALAVSRVTTMAPRCLPMASSTG